MAEADQPKSTPKNYLVKSNSTLNDLPQVMQCIIHFNRVYFSKLEGIDVFIAGGAVRDYFSIGKTTESDIDFYSKERKELAKLVWVLRKEYQFKPFLISKNAIKGTGVVNGKKQDIDIVKVIFNTMQEAIDMFDFTACCFAVSSTNFVCHPSAMFDLMAKRLVVNNLPYPLSTLQRMQKYIKKGYWICNGGMLEIAKAMSAIDFNDAEQNNIEMYPDGSPRFVRFD